MADADADADADSNDADVESDLLSDSLNDRSNSLAKVVDRWLHLHTPIDHRTQLICILYFIYKIFIYEITGFSCWS